MSRLPGAQLEGPDDYLGIGGTYAAESSWNQMQTSHIALYVDPIKLPVRIPMHKRTGASDFRTTVTCSREYLLRCASFFPFFSGAGMISTLFRPQSRAVTHMVETSNRTGVSALPGTYPSPPARHCYTWQGDVLYILEIHVFGRVKSLRPRGKTSVRGPAAWEASRANSSHA